MRGRYGVAAVFAAALALVLILRHEGYLHGRVEGGPLTLSGGGAGATVKPGRTVAFGLDVKVDGDAVEVQSVKGEFVSPGLRLLGPRRSAKPCGACVVRHWPPAGSTPLRDGEVRGATPALLGARAPQRGIYYVRNLVALYNRGAKSYRRTVGADFCVVVARTRRRLACPLSYQPPRRATVAEAGGPSRYGVPVRVAAADTRARATYPARTGTRTVGITLTNLTDIQRAVSGLGAEVDSDGAQVTIRQVQPERVVIQPHDGRRIRLEIVIEGCSTGDGVAATVGQLHGQVGQDLGVVPLSVALAFSAPRACA
jgi:hypothetical protein